MEARATTDSLDRLARIVLAGPAALFREIGEFTLFTGQILFWALRPPYRIRVYLESLFFAGVGSIFIVFLVAGFVGAVLALQTVVGFEKFNAESMVGGVIGLSFTREMAPVFTALLLAARAGSAMATELGTMRVSDQIDALSTMGINPIQYLVAPRVVSCTLMAPLLCMVFNFVGIGSAYALCVIMLNLDPGIFQDNVANWVAPRDVTGGLMKALVLGFFVSAIACRRGFYATGGAAGVGNATTKAVVHGFVMIFVLDYFLTSLLQM